MQCTIVLLQQFVCMYSAGGTGVLLNVDRVAAQVAKLARQVEVRGIADSGWFLDNAQYRPGLCTSA